MGVVPGVVVDQSRAVSHTTVLVVFGGLLGYSGDDLNKFLWMVRIAEGIWPDEVAWIIKTWGSYIKLFFMAGVASSSTRYSPRAVKKLLTPPTGTRCLITTTSRCSRPVRPWTVCVAQDFPPAGNSDW
jgi:hypothetical protein